RNARSTSTSSARFPPYAAVAMKHSSSSGNGGKASIGFGVAVSSAESSLSASSPSAIDEGGDSTLSLRDELLSTTETATWYVAREIALAAKRYVVPFASGATVRLVAPSTSTRFSVTSFTP